MTRERPTEDQPYPYDDERLSAYLDGELSAPEQAQLEARLVTDAPLRQLVDELRTVRQQLEVLPEYKLGPDFAARVMQRAEQQFFLEHPTSTVSPGAFAASSSISAESVVSPDTPVSVVESQVSPVQKPREQGPKPWRVVAIWSTVAAAAALLLLVTQPSNELTVSHGMPKQSDNPTAAKSASKAALPLSRFSKESEQEAIVSQAPTDGDFRSNSVELTLQAAQAGVDKRASQEQSKFSLESAGQSRDLNRSKESSALRDNQFYDEANSGMAGAGSVSDSLARKQSQSLSSSVAPSTAGQQSIAMGGITADTPAPPNAQPPVAKYHERADDNASSKPVDQLAGNFGTVSGGHQQDYFYYQRTADQPLYVVQLKQTVASQANGRLARALQQRSIQLADATIATAGSDEVATTAKPADRQAKTQIAVAEVNGAAATTQDQKQLAQPAETRTADSLRRDRVAGVQPPAAELAAAGAELLATGKHQSAVEVLVLDVDRTQLDLLLADLQQSPESFPTVQVGTPLQLEDRKMLNGQLAYEQHAILPAEKRADDYVESNSKPSANESEQQPPIESKEKQLAESKQQPQPASSMPPAMAYRLDFNQLPTQLREQAKSVEVAEPKADQLAKGGYNGKEALALNDDQQAGTATKPQAAAVLSEPTSAAGSGASTADRAKGKQKSAGNKPPVALSPPMPGVSRNFQNSRNEPAPNKASAGADAFGAPAKHEPAPEAMLKDQVTNAEPSADKASPATANAGGSAPRANANKFMDQAKHIAQEQELLAKQVQESGLAQSAPQLPATVNPSIARGRNSVINTPSKPATTNKIPVEPAAPNAGFAGGMPKSESFVAEPTPAPVLELQPLAKKSLPQRVRVVFFVITEPSPASLAPTLPMP